MYFIVTLGIKKYANILAFRIGISIGRLDEKNPKKKVVQRDNFDDI